MESVVGSYLDSVVVAVHCCRCCSIHSHCERNEQSMMLMIFDDDENPFANNKDWFYQQKMNLRQQKTHQTGRGRRMCGGQ